MKKFNLSKGLIVGLLTFALCIVAFAAVGAKADEQAAAAPTKTAAVVATYDAANDAVISTKNQTAYVYVVKAASGNKIKSGQTAAGQMAAGKISISDLGIKGTNKDVFLYVWDKEVEVADGETVSANLTIQGNANKVVGAVDYTQADHTSSVNVLSAYYVDKASKKNVDIASASLYWAAEAAGPFYLANDATVGSGTTGRKIGNAYVTNGFNGKDLADMLEAGGTIYIKQAGTSGASGTAQFGSKVAKVKIAKQAKAPKAKIDVAKDTIALKNGFDFAVVTKSQGSTEYDSFGTWWTILPSLKTATVSSDGETIIGGILGTGNSAKTTVYKPLDKKDSNAGKAVEATGKNQEGQDFTYYQYSYTKNAIKALSIDRLFDVLKTSDNTKLASGDFKIAIRKSATNKKPASAVTLIDLAYQTEAPLVYTKDNVEGQFLVASADEFSKKGLTLSSIAAFPGYKVVDGEEVVATTGFDKSFKIDAAANTIKERDDGTTFEYAVVSTADYFATGDAAIDWTTVKWKKFDPAKLKITEKLSGKYSTLKGAKKVATLKSTASGDISTGADKKENDAYGRVIVKESVIKADTKALLLIRRAGDKSSGLRGSEAIALYVAKEGKQYKLYSTVSNGQQAKKYTLYFFKYSTPEGKTAGFYRDDTIAPVSGWTRNATVGVKLDALTNADYFALGDTVSSENSESFGMASLDATPVKYVAKTAQNAVTASPADDPSNGTDAVPAGSYAFAVGGGYGSDVGINVAIREYANVKIQAVAYEGEAEVTNSAQVVASVVNGVPQVLSGANFVAPDGGTVPNGEEFVYVGSETEIYLRKLASAWTVPSGYAKKDPLGTPIVDVGEGYQVPQNAYTTGQDNAKVTATVKSADDVVITIKFQAVKTYTITVDGNGGKWGTATTKTYTTDGKKCIPTTAAALFTTGDGVTAPDGKVFDTTNKLNTKADGTGTAITDATTFNADTTIYVIYKNAE